MVIRGNLCYSVISYTNGKRREMLIDELKALAKKAEISGCVVGVWAQGQEPEFQEVLSSLRKNNNVNVTQILGTIKAHHPDVPFKRTAFAGHMRGDCSCQTA